MLSLDLGSFFSTRLARHAASVERSQARLASGTRLNSAADGPTDLVTADALRAQIEGTRTAEMNIQQAMAISGVTQDSVQNLFPTLNRMMELILSAANDDKSLANRQYIQTELDQLREDFKEAYLDASKARVALDGATASDRILHFQVGGAAGDVVSVDFNSLRSVLGDALVNFYGYEGIYNDQTFREFLVPRFGSPPPPPNQPMPPTGATLAQLLPKKLIADTRDPAVKARSLDLVQGVQQGLQKELVYFGAISNRLQLQLEQNGALMEQMTTIESRLRDTDMASEMTRLSSGQIMQQAAQAMLAQSNSRPQQVLELLNTR